MLSAHIVGPLNNHLWKVFSRLCRNLVSAWRTRLQREINCCRNYRM